MDLKLERIYTKEPDMSGYRILIDRLWPRGVSKVKAHLDLWAKYMGPSKELRQWFNHEPAKFPEFKQRYLAEIQANPEHQDFLALVNQTLKKQSVILLYGAKDTENNQAVVLAEWLNKNKETK
ncbi:DUF488 domain-containing protein [Agrilactobacillus yilanensis]|uniref:DUF488 domain-containing protein n=1 Tax=Agrilactobacillus yilanensis TaxID=2485997 RepID=A0ABW4J7V4_9LACO|nr:DUF488 family protein [Agrilactobacillus yilanensis]